MKAHYYITAARFVQSQSHWLGFNLSNKVYLWLKTRWYVKNFNKHTFGYDITGRGLSKFDLAEMSNQFIPDGAQKPLTGTENPGVTMDVEPWEPTGEEFWEEYVGWFGKLPDRD